MQKKKKTSAEPETTAPARRAFQPGVPSEQWEPLPQNINREDPPDFYRMSFTRFEEMTCSLLDKEPNVQRADLYHTRFDAQYGIDCFGDLDDGMIVASCKCQKAIKKDEIAKWTQDFLDHWETIWKDRGIKKFILSTAAPTEHRNRLADINAQKARFAELGIEYEVWSPRQLQEKLRPHRGLVSQYVGSAFVTTLCSDEAEAPLLKEALAAQSFLTARVEDLGEALSGEVEQRFAIARTELERGRITEAATIVRSLRNRSNWPDLSSDLRARIIRLQGSISLSKAEYDEAVSYSNEADDLSPPDEPRLKANIAFYSKGAAEALRVLGAPTTEAGKSFQAALFLAQFELDKAESRIADLIEGPERLRLTALLLLYRGDREGAKSVVDTALVAAPDNLNIRRISAMVRFASALSNLAAPQNYAFAAPFASSLLKTDDASTDALRAALAIVDEILKFGEPTSPGLDWPWRLACLANLPDERAEAAKQASDILRNDQTNASAIGWSMIRGLDVDLKPSREALLAALRAGTLGPHGPRGLEWTSGPDEHASLLAEAEAALAAHPWPEDTVGELKTLIGRLGGQVDLDPDTASAKRVTEAITGGQASDAIAEFRRLRAEKPIPIYLLAAAEYLASINEWEVLQEGIAELMAFGTADAFRICGYAAFNSGNYLQALSILSENVKAFPGGRLPFDLQRIEMLALANTGDGSKALVRAEAIAAETRKVSDRMLEARIRLQMGDLQGAVTAVRTAVSADQLQAGEALWWSSRLAQQDTELARELWRSAIAADPLPDHVAATAYHLSFTLGVEHERPDLFAVIPRLVAAGAPGFKMVKIDDLKDLIAESREQSARLEAMITRGDAPIHMVARAANTSLAELLQLGDGSEPGLHPVFLRSAARAASPQDRPWDEWNLYIDVTGLLIADQLGLLDHVESHRNRPRIGRSIIQALISIEEDVRHPQPSRVAAAQAILGEIGRSIQLISPASCIRIVHEPASDEFDVHAVVRGLNVGGWIDDTVYERARAKMGSTKEPASHPEAGTALVFAEQTLDLLAGAGLLQAVTSAFTVYLDPDSLALTRAEANRGARAAALITWISKLRDRISRGLQTGRYVFAEKTAEPSDADAKDNPIYVSLLEIMRSSEAAGENRLWADDRLLNSYQNAGSSRVVGVIEVLDALRTAGKVGDDFYYEALRKLRLGGALFIPVTVEELVRHLDKAPVVSRVVAETPALVAIRRNLSLALSYQDGLRLGQEHVAGEVRPSELPYLMAVRRLLEGAIVDRWNSANSDEVVKAHCNWIWASLRLEQPPRPEGQAHNDPYVMAALNIAGLISSAIHLNGNGQEGHQRRTAYLEWVNSSIVRTRLEADEKLGERIGNLARTLLRIDQAPGEQFDEEARKYMRQAAKLVVYELPSPLQEIVAADETFRRDLGIETGSVLTLEDKAFLASEFWDGIRQAVNSGSAEVQTADRDGKIEIGKPSDAGVFPITGAIAIRLNEPASALLSTDGAVRERRILDEISELDIEGDAVSGFRARIAGSTNAYETMRLVAELREQSVPHYLTELSKALHQSSNNVGMARFKPPAASDWLRYLRWKPVVGSDLETWFSEAVAGLGLEEATGRFSSLPISLSQDTNELLQVRDPDTVTFMGSIHRLHALRMSGVAAHPVLTDAADEVVKACTEHGQLFVALLRWSAQCFMQQDDWPRLSAAERSAVVWAFADNLTAILLGINADPVPTAEFFLKRLHWPPARSLNLMHEYDDTPIIPGALSHVGILLAGLEYGLGSEADNIAFSDEQMGRLRAVTSVQSDQGVPVCRPERSMPFAETPYPTWMSRPSPDAVVEGAGQIEQSLAAMVGKLEQEPELVDGWDFLVAFGRPALPPDLVAKLDDVLMRVDLKRLSDADPDGAVALRKVAEVAGTLGGRDASDRILNALFAFSRDWLSEPLSADFTDRVNVMVEAAASASKSFSGDGRTRLSNFLRALIANRMGVAEALRAVLNMLNDDTRVSEADDFWRVLLVARASR